MEPGALDFTSRRAGLVGLLAIAVAGSACGGFGVSPRRGGSIGFFGEGADPAATPRPPTQATAEAEPLPDDPAQALQQVGQYLTGRGFKRTRQAGSLQLPPSGTTTVPLNLPSGRCYTVAAMGPKGVDVNLTVLNPWGNVIRADVRPDRHPWAAFCTGMSGRYTLRFQGPGGQSIPVHFAVFEGSPALSPGLRAYYAAAAGGGAPQVQAIGLPPALSGRVQAVAQRFAAEGFGLVGQPVAYVLRAGGALDLGVTGLRPGCYRFAVLGQGGGVAQSGAVLLDSQGTVLARGTALQSAADTFLEFCPGQPTDGRLRISAMQGNGPLAVAVFSRGGASGSQQTGLGEAEASGGALEQFAFVDGDMRSRGYQRSGEPQRLTLAPGTEATVQTSLEPGKCYAFLAVGDPVSVADVDLVVRDTSGQVLDVDVARDNRPVVRVCPRSGGQHVVQVRMFDGSGEVIFARYDWPRGIRGPFGLQGLAYVRFAENVALLEAEGFEPDDAFVPVRGRFRRMGETKKHRLRLRGGRCYAVLVVGGDGVRLVRASLRVGGQPVAESLDTLTPFTSVRYCAEQDVRAEVLVSNPSVFDALPTQARENLSERPGPYVLQLFQQR